MDEEPGALCLTLHFITSRPASSLPTPKGWLCRRFDPTGEDEVFFHRIQTDPRVRAFQ